MQDMNANSAFNYVGGSNQPRELEILRDFSKCLLPTVRVNSQLPTQSSNPLLGASANSNMFIPNARPGYGPFQISQLPPTQDCSPAHGTGLPSYGASASAEVSFQGLLKANNSKAILTQVEQINQLIKALEQKRSLLLQSLSEASTPQPAIAMFGQGGYQNAFTDMFSSGFLSGNQIHPLGSTSLQANVGQALPDYNDSGLIQTIPHPEPSCHQDHPAVKPESPTSMAKSEVLATLLLARSLTLCRFTSHVISHRLQPNGNMAATRMRMELGAASGTSPTSPARSSLPLRLPARSTL